jgi:two-component system response regulator AtoC
MITAEQGSTQPSKSASRLIIAESRVMREILNFIERVAASEASSFLIEGENGTGKDLVATTLHYQSFRKAGPFLAINCAAIPETLLESELFGYEKGAFTDARAQKRGLFELADRGTLFLDEIDSIAHSLQAKLLRVLENQSLRRLGGIHDLSIDIRIIAATNRDLRQAVKEGAFRQDLYYRLNVIQIVIPPLRERIADVLPLAQFFIEHYNQKFSRRIDGVTEETRNILVTHNWPGNVRELRNTIEHAMILEETTLIRPGSLPADLQVGTGSQKAATGAFVGDWMSLPGQERRLLIQALGKTRGNQTHAAKLLHITRDTLRYRMKKFHLD